MWEKVLGRNCTGLPDPWVNITRTDVDTICFSGESVQSRRSTAKNIHFSIFVHSDPSSVCDRLSAVQRYPLQWLLSHAVCCWMHRTQRLRLPGKRQTPSLIQRVSVVFSVTSLCCQTARCWSIEFSHSSPLQACRHFNDSGVCKENCPPPTIYDTVTFQTKPNPNKKFNFGATCVESCPCENPFLLKKNNLVHSWKLQHSAQLCGRRAAPADWAACCRAPWR